MSSDFFRRYYVTRSIARAGTMYGWDEDNALESRGDVRTCDVLDELIAYKKRGYSIGNSLKHLEWMKVYFGNVKQLLLLKCRVGVSNFSIDPYGNVRLCFNMEPIGNIRFDTPERLYNSINSKRQRKSIRKCGMRCRILSCNF